MPRRLNKEEFLQKCYVIYMTEYSERNGLYPAVTKEDYATKEEFGFEERWQKYNSLMDKQREGFWKSTEQKNLFE